jgi:hypothetical protein
MYRGDGTVYPDVQVQPELTGSTPRNVALTAGSQVGRSLLFLLLFAMVVGIPIFAIRDLNNLRDLEANGRPVRGYVNGKDIDYGRHSDTYYLDYIYTVGGVEYTGKDSVPQSQYDSTVSGDAVRVYYLPSNPADHHFGAVTDDTINNSTISWELLAAIAIGICLLIAISNELNLRNQLRLMRDGIPVSAMVADLQVIRGKSTRYVAVCNYYAGQVPISKRYTVSRSYYTCLTQGTPITVLVDPSKPGNSLPYQTLTAVVIRGMARRY